MRTVLTLAMVLVLGDAWVSAQAVQAGAARGAPRKVPSGVSVLVIDPELRATKARMVGLDSRAGVLVMDESGIERRIGVERVIAVIASDPSADPGLGVGGYTPASRRRPPTSEQIEAMLAGRSSGLLVTTDGQRFPGTLRPRAASGHDGGQDVLRWVHPLRGEFECSLDRAAGVWFSLATQGEVVIGAAPSQDELRLANGDTLRGLVASLDGSSASVEVDRAVQTVPIEMVSGVILANPRVPITGACVWLGDGTVVNVSAVSAGRAQDALSITPVLGAMAWEVGIGDVRAWTPAAERLVPLSLIRPSGVRALGGRVHTDPPGVVPNDDDLTLAGAAVLEASDLVLPGPMEVVYEMPTGASRLAFSAALEDENGAWGDAELVVMSEGVERSRARLTESEPVSAVNAIVGAGPLTLRLEAGKYGPVKCRVRLMRPLIRVERPGGAAR